MSTTVGQISTLIQATLHAAEVRLAEEIPISAIGLDSRQLPEGGLFAALPGTRNHGAHYAGSTAAAAILSDAEGTKILRELGETRPILEVADIRAVLGYVAAEVYDHPSEKMTIIGITGTSGKTTTSYLLETGLIAAGYSVGLIGTTGTRINGKPVPTQLTTPEAPTLQALFARMLNDGVTHVVMEVSSHALSLGRTVGTHFKVAGFTNLSQDHLDFHSTMEEYFAAKALFFEPTSDKRAQTSVICVDDPWGEKMAQRAINPIRVSTTNNHGDVIAHAIESDPTGAQSFQLRAGNKDYHVVLPLPGIFNVANASLALAIAENIGVDMSAVIDGMSQVSVPGRMQRIDAGQEFLAVVDYAHKPAAIAAVLETIRNQISGRIGIVIGAGGDRDAAKRPIMGAESVRRADLVIVTDDNPRSEDPAVIRQAVLAGAYAIQQERPEVEIAEIGDRRKAIAAAISWAQPGDAVIVAGKGHEVGQLIAGVNHHFDDREEVQAALQRISQ
ncbi:UDP-N-acetylmuramoylalanyl-D-glutamate-2, 6-diaminopimelate ligase [Corynebacterium kutscheri]|uniref:UDP-N-acetylmuramoyl-L-alanyl-D-glutamate--2,6-diaminopimelate ligase n=1 Tax=Corynebacterium kutscheri TaxID=35755 RepID=A0A0F6R0Y9_9CORY|nr:UDP-N-acetylmuramoyl-L-alanyl-D-glutamate--2,6-diaminopimelate ligase [Corynebacterium kutscheri]AKE41565.1 UDP-N-acetylmuramoylalanyl-D-glutamate--2,6-diaminopimelate ligase [Corynebacterium kutscheri]VEH08844.1 UDP-N-acetylmuramoylalanyl-D-glutamate-2, 6-diaminopimelate ligase [Corynebacterium kutscheri]VEH09889.1 UDP-N-acetylmuramoylalanyl-D-glutamate-2, 6-diaminopimelate ligase [Corynebacterium kutscheri]VEH79973.1 UDP-N-acetylmuramoylalanyl-D-glutamate-2, 6-diaminopimelate ligase [Coryn